MNKCNQHLTSEIAFNSQSGRRSEYCKACDKVHFVRWFGTLEHRKAAAQKWAEKVTAYMKENSLFVRLMRMC